MKWIIQQAHAIRGVIKGQTGEMTVDEVQKVHAESANQ